MDKNKKSKSKQDDDEEEGDKMSLIDKIKAVLFPPKKVTKEKIKQKKMMKKRRDDEDEEDNPKKRKTNDEDEEDLYGYSEEQEEDETEEEQQPPRKPKTQANDNAMNKKKMMNKPRDEDEEDLYDYSEEQEEDETEEEQQPPRKPKTQANDNAMNKKKMMNKPRDEDEEELDIIDEEQDMDEPKNKKKYTEEKSDNEEMKGRNKGYTRKVPNKKQTDYEEDEGELDDDEKINSEEEEETEEEQQPPRKPNKKNVNKKPTVEPDDDDNDLLEQAKTNKDKSFLDRINPFSVFETKIKSYIEYYGDDLNNIRKSYKNALKALIPATIMVTLIGILKIKFFLFSVPLLILISYLYPFLYTWSKAGEQKKLIAAEAPFISLTAYIDSLVDKGLNNTFEALSQLKEMKVAKIEQNFIKKMTDYMNTSFTQAIEKRANVHVGDALGKLYSNYLAAISLGIGVKERLRDVMRELLNDLRDTYKSYLDKSSELTELIFSLFLLVPITLIGFSFTFKASLIELLAPVMVAPALYFVIASSQPFAEYNIKYKKYLPIFITIPIIALLPSLSLTIKVFLMVVVLTGLSYAVYPQIKLAKDLEKALPILLKEVAQYIKIGYTVQNAIPRVKLTSKRVTEVIKKYSRNPEEVDSPSRLFNIGFKLMFITSKTGTSSIALDELGTAINDVTYTKNSIIKQLNLFDMLTILTPVLLWMTFGMLGHIGSSNSTPISVVIGAYSLASAMLFSKISRFTILYFPTMLILTVILGVLLFAPIKLPA